MKFKLTIVLALFTIVSITSCQDDVFDENSKVVAKETEAKSEKNDSKEGRKVSTNPDTYILSYQGNNTWKGWWGGVNLTFSGCTQTELEAGNQCAFFLQGATGGGAIGFTSNTNAGSVDVSTWTIQKVKFNTVQYNFATYEFEVIEVTFHTAGIKNYPFRIIFENHKPVLVHPDYSTFPDIDPNSL